MSTASQAQNLNPGNLITFLKVDFSTCIGFKPTGNAILYCCSHRDGSSNITFEGQVYEYIGFDVNGFRSELNGQPPTPGIIFDKSSLLTNQTYTIIWNESINASKDYYMDWRGAKLSIFRVFNLSTNQKLETEEYIATQVIRETSTTLEIDLTVSLGIQKANNESVTKLSTNRCALRYRRWNATKNDFDYTPEDAGGCPYGNPTTKSDWSAVPSFGIKFFTNRDQALTDANKNLDMCSYTVKGCQIRFDPGKNGLALPFTGLYSPNTLGRQ